MHSERHSSHLQAVQNAEMGQINLPPSIPISMDGEEGAYAYNKRLQQSNAEALKRLGECYIPPPNRTILQGSDGGLALLSTSTPKQLTTTTTTAESLETKERGWLFKSPTPSRNLSPKHTSDDYVSSSLLSSWRNASSDVLEMSSSSKSYLASLSSHPADSTAAAGVYSLDDPSRRQKQRSSSADSVRKLAAVVKWPFSLFSKKHSSSKTTSSKSQLQQLAKPDDKPPPPLEEAESIHGKGSEPWDLPPNYVDMIFTKGKDPVTNEKETQLAEKHQQKKQQRTSTAPIPGLPKV